jgi:hypothetical protein
MLTRCNIALTFELATQRVRGDRKRRMVKRLHKRVLETVQPIWKADRSVAKHPCCCKQYREHDIVRLSRLPSPSGAANLFVHTTGQLVPAAHMSVNSCS